MRVVFESRNRRACSDRALVLESSGIPYEIVEDALSCVLVVPDEYSARAAEELRLYDDENPPFRPRRRRLADDFSAAPGLAGYVLLICGVAWLAGVDSLGKDWLSAGRIDGELVRNGEIWRAITALTLHSGMKHLAGNLVFGIFFGLFAGRLVGSGVAWASIVLAAAAGNLVNTLLLTPTHASIGASTAVFAALGLVAGHVWRAKLMRQDRWPLRIGPIVGGLALLMYTGTGGPNTDIGAHLMGFLCGFGAGVLLARWRDRFRSATLQRICGAAAVLLPALAWIIALAV